MSKGANFKLDMQKVAEKFVCSEKNMYLCTRFQEIEALERW